MLIYNRTTNYSVASLIAQSIQAGQLIVAREGTPLYDLSVACLGVGSVGHRLDASQLVESADTLSIRIVNDSLDRELHVLSESVDEDETIKYGVSSHSAAFIGVASAMAEVIKRNITLCERAAEDIGRAFDKVNQLFSRKDTVVPINIVPLVGSGDLASLGTFESFVRGLVPQGREVGDSGDAPVCYPRIETLDEFPVLELVTVGHPQLDAQLKQWAADGGAKLLLEVYNRFYTNQSIKDTYYRIRHEDLNHLEGSATVLDGSIALLLLSLNLGKTSIEELSGITVEEIEFGHTSTRVFAAHAAIMEFERIKRARKTGVVVHQYPREVTAYDDWHSGTYDIIVDDVTYDEFISEGGTPEMLFGAYLVDRLMIKEEILAQGERLAKAWADGEATLRRQRHQDEVTRIFATVRGQCYRDFNELPPEHRAAIEAELVARELDRFNEHLGKTGADQLYVHMRELYTSIFYSGTEVKELLRTIDEVAVDSQATSRDAITRMAVIEYTSRLLMEQVQSVEYVDNEGA